MKWLFLNAKQRLRRIVASPGYAVKAAWREVTWADEWFLSHITGERVSRIRQFMDEPAHTPEFLRHVSECEKTFSTLSIESADLYAKKVLIQYAIVRAMRPETIVETGVANGVSSAHLLLALHKNSQGTLHSIEIGDSTYLPAGRESGWVVPDWLRGRWKFHLGDASEVLPPLLRELRSIDLFIHDSLHTYEHMKFEFERAFPFVRAKGLLLADDALWNEAFWDFARATMSPKAQILHGVGVLRKETQCES
jgi:predicted O-methyltransferase YrrM